MKDIYILAAKRTPFGRFNGKLKNFSATKLAEIALLGAISEAKISAEMIDTLILGNVVQSGQGQNIARQVALNSGLNQRSTAMVLNQVCGSSLKAVRVAQGLMELGDAQIVAVGGTESMSNIPFYESRENQKSGTTNLVDGLLQDGLMDAFSGQHMGVTAENVATKYQIDRKAQDEFALNSHQKAFAAVQNNWFENEIVPIENNGEWITQDENIRRDTNMDKLSKLKTIFKEDGSVTAGNSSPLSDGASMLILATKEKINELGLKPIAKLKGYAEVGIEPEIMGYAPFYAINTLLEKENKTVTDFDAFEINEAFSAQAYAVARDLNIPKSKLNIAGGALALGHPLGATGARMIITLLNNLRNNEQKNGIASLCIGGGMGIAYEIEMVN